MSVCIQFPAGFGSSRECQSQEEGLLYILGNKRKAREVVGPQPKEMGDTGHIKDWGT